MQILVYGKVSPPNIITETLLKKEARYLHVYLNSVQQMVSGEYGRGLSWDTVC